MSDDLNHELYATYASGEWVAMAEANAWCLVNAAAEDPLVSEIWAGLREHASRSVIERLLEEYPDDQRPSFGLVTMASGVIQLLLSGTTLGILEGDGTSDQMRCPAGVSVAEYRLAGNSKRLTVVGSESTDAARFPIHSGVTRASTLILEWSTGAAHTGEGSVPAAELRSATSERSRADAPITVADTAATASTLPGTLNPDLLAEEPSAGEAPGPTEADSDTDYDYLFGQTVARSIEDAAVRAIDVGEAALSHPVAPPEVAVSDRGLTALPDPAKPSPVQTASVIDAVPGIALQGRELPAPAPPLGGVEDIELTVNRASQAMLLQQLKEGASVEGGPLVHAVRCPANHPNPAHATLCRICATPIADQVPVTGPRPVLGCLRFSTGDAVVLDRGVLMGRGPTEGRQAGGERPHLVKLPSPDHEISRNHVEVRLDGWHVLVVDLNSTNGTLVIRPGLPPERLRPEEPTMIEPGCTVALSDEITFTYEATA